jgi:hypothetical protein
MDSTTVAPSLALLLGLRFPAHMRAGRRGDLADDDLDVLWQIADPAAFPATYLADRRQAVARFREENRDQLLRWSGRQDSWTGFYKMHRQAQECRELSALATILVVLLLLSVYPSRPSRPGRSGSNRPPDHGRRRDALLCMAWVTGVYLATYLLTLVLRGSVDPTAINERGPFIRFGLGLSAAVLLGAGVLHLLLRRSPVALRADVLALLAVTLLVNLLHPVVFGWHLGFPIPAPVFIYLPYFASMFLLTLCALALPLCFVHRRESARPSA